MKIIQDEDKKYVRCLKSDVNDAFILSTSLNRRDSTLCCLKFIKLKYPTRSFNASENNILYKELFKTKRYKILTELRYRTR